MACPSNGYGTAIGQLDSKNYAGMQEGMQEGTRISAVGSAEYTMEQARELSMRLMSLADRITGPVPTSPASAGKSIDVDPMGVFPILMSSSERTQAIISEGFEAINRIERSLP